MIHIGIKFGLKECKGYIDMKPGTKSEFKGGRPVIAPSRQT
jgi:hypothetical protein